METDPWLDHWLPGLGAPAATRLLELGCDTGRDTTRLARHGFTVVATDIAQDALRRCREAVPSALVVCHDLRRPLPFADNSFDVIIASLCLHYFDWPATLAIVTDIARCLEPGGLLLCRLNSTRDVHHGAVGCKELAPNYFLVNDYYSSCKRFFDQAAIDALFDPAWQRLSVEEHSIDRYPQPKMVWELLLRR